MNFKKIAVYVLVALLIFTPFSLQAKADSTYDIVALGDSLASGINEQGKLGKGYADFLADYIAENNQLKSFNKGFSYPGYKTTNVLNDLVNNVEKQAMDQTLEYGASVILSVALKEAEIVTLSVGANDVLANLTRNSDGTFTFDTNEVLASIEVVKANVTKIMQEVKTHNPDVKIVVMGYYNPFPAMTSFAFQLNYLVSTLDAKIGEAVKAEGGIFVLVKDEIATNAKTYLPNPDNIHLSEAGYKAVALKMYNALGFPPYEPFELPKDVPADHWAASYIEKAMKAKIFTGNTDGTFKPSNAIKRIEMTSLIARQFALPVSSTKLPFTDVDKVAQNMFAELQAVYSAGIVKGDLSGKFNPGANITREQFALVLLRTHEKVMNSTYTEKATTTFTDIQTLSAESQKAIKFLAENDLVDAVEKFNPSSSLQRAQGAKILVNYNESFGK